MSANEYGVVVDSCPLSEVKTREAASRLNCSVDENGRSRYVCVPNQDLSALVEFCYTKTIVGLYQAGNCLKMIGNGFLDKISCKNFLEGCPADHFRSTDLFQYPACHRLNTDKRCFLLDPTCSPKTNETEQNSEFGKEGAIIAVTVSVLILMLLIILTIACVLWRRRKRKNRNENRGMEDEEVNIPLTSPEIAPYHDKKDTQSDSEHSTSSGENSTKRVAPVADNTEVKTPIENPSTQPRPSDSSGENSTKRVAPVADNTEVKTPIENPSTQPRPSDRAFAEKDRKIIVHRLLELFDNLKDFLENEEYDESLKESLEKNYPDYLTSIEKKKADLMKADHGIVIAGETSAGKSTLINRILRKGLFPERNEESTSTVCKIRNTENVSIVVETEENESEEIKLDCDPDTKKGLTILREELKKFTDLVSSEGSERYRSVDVGFPIPFLKGNTIIVDTPGIGGSKHITRKLMEYLRYAVSFIFVIDVTRAGGMQSDRLPEILRAIIDLQIDDEMPCFDPRGVIFITNKWDSLRGTQEFGEEDVETRTWRKVKRSIQKNWPDVQDENIFRLNLINVQDGKANKDVDTFKRVRKTLDTVIKENENIRITHHFNFLQSIINDVKIEIDARLEVALLSEEEQALLLEENKEKLKKLKEDCEGKGKLFRKRLRDLIEKIAEESYKYAMSENGKQKILNPAGCIPIMKISYAPQLFVLEIQERVEMFVHGKVTAPEVKEEFKSIIDDVLEFYKDISSELSEMEKEWTGSGRQDKKDQEESSAPIIIGTIITIPLLIPVLAAGIALALGSVGVAVASAPITIPLIFYLGRDARKQQIINEEYEKCTGTIHGMICSELEKLYEYRLQKSIEKITDFILPKRIEKFHDVIERLSSNRRQILENQEHLTRLSTMFLPITKELEGICKLVK